MKLVPLWMWYGTFWKELQFLNMILNGGFLSFGWVYRTHETKQLKDRWILQKVDLEKEKKTVLVIQRSQRHSNDDYLFLPILKTNLKTKTTFWTPGGIQFSHVVFLIL